MANDFLSPTRRKRFDIMEDIISEKAEQQLPEQQERLSQRYGMGSPAIAEQLGKQKIAQQQQTSGILADLLGQQEQERMATEKREDIQEEQREMTFAQWAEQDKARQQQFQQQKEMQQMSHQQAIQRMEIQNEMAKEARRKARERKKSSMITNTLMSVGMGVATGGISGALGLLGGAGAGGGALMGALGGTETVGQMMGSSMYEDMLSSYPNTGGMNKEDLLEYGQGLSNQRQNKARSDYASTWRD